MCQGDKIRRQGIEKNLHSVSNLSPFFPLSFDKQNEQPWAFETNSTQRRKTDRPVFKSIYAKYHIAKGPKKTTLEFSFRSKDSCPSSHPQLSLCTAGRSHTLKTTGSVLDDWSKMAKWSLQAAQETWPAFRGHPVAQRKGVFVHVTLSLPGVRQDHPSFVL